MIARAAIVLSLVGAAAFADDAPLGASAKTTARAAVARTEVYPAGALVGAAAEHLRSYLREHHPTLARIEIEPAGNVADLHLPAGTLAVRPRFLAASGGLSKRVCVWLDVRVNDKLERSVPVWLTVSAYAPTLVAKRAIKPREKLAPAWFSAEERDVAALGRNPLATAGDIVGQRARSFIAAGAIVQMKDLERSPSVIADDLVDVRVQSGPIVIETQAVAQQDGYVGDRVRLRNPTTAAIYTARVVGDKSVLVTER